MPSLSLQPASVLLKSADKVHDSSLAMKRNEESGTAVDGVCSSWLPPLCFTAAETKRHFLPGRPFV